MQSTTFGGINEEGILLFYGWWQMAVCLFAFLGLMSIWWHIGKKQGDSGQVWLALSILSWSLSGATEVIFATNTFSINQDSYLQGFRSIFSLSNSLFILLGLPWFHYLPQKIKPIVQSKYWLFIVGLPFIFSMLPTISKMVSGKLSGPISELDVYYAVMTLSFLGWVLWESFAKRRLKLLAWLSLLCIITTFIAQIYKLTGSSINLTLFSAIFKTSLIMLFFALALSWVKELAESIIPKPTQLFLTFSPVKNEKTITLFGIPGKTKSIKLTPGMYGLLLNFAQKKKGGNDWLEIKPKNDPTTNRAYDVQDHNEIRRLITAILDGLLGKGNWEKESHETPLKAALFEMSEKRERKIRLLIPAENITLPTPS